MVTQVFPGEFSSLAPIAQFVEQQAQAAGLSDDAIYSVQLAVDEACSNIIEHGYGGEGLGDIKCICNILSQGLEIVLMDQGKKFDPDALPEPRVGAPLEDLGSRGAGVFLMRKLMDKVDFHFDDAKGTTLTLFKSK